MVLAVASMTAFYSCGPSAEDQAKAEDMANELGATLDEAVDAAAAETTEEATTEEEVVADSTSEEVTGEEATTEETPAEEATEETEEAPAE